MYSKDDQQRIFIGLLLYRVRLREMQAVKRKDYTDEIASVEKLAKQLCIELYGHENLAKFVL